MDGTQGWVGRMELGFGSLGLRWGLRGDGWVGCGLDTDYKVGGEATQ